MKIAKVNRMKAQRARRTQGWCDRCDRDITTNVGKGRKCRACGGWNKPAKKKKIVVPSFELDLE